MARKKRRGSLVGVLDEEAKLSLTPMIDISFLILIFFMCLPFKTLEGKLAAFLPTDKGIAPTEEEPPQVIQIKVHILARKEVLIPNWGVAKQNIKRPTLVKFKFNQRETESIEDIGRWIAEAMKENEGSETEVVGEIKAAHKVPHMFVVAILNKFKEAKMKKVDFFGTAIPKADLRRFQYLPYPTSNY